MRITALEEYGLRCLVTLARKGHRKQTSISEIAEIEGLSVPYASKLLSILRQAGLVRAVRGRGGGFSLTRHPGELTLLEVITTLGGPLIDPEHCARYTGQLDLCVHSGNCSVQEVLHGLAGYLSEWLSQTTLQDLINKESASVHRASILDTISAAATSQPARVRQKGRRNTAKSANAER
jgi:Rrf2 family iron-sulfur cluster assembly transcriptional regulator